MWIQTSYQYKCRPSVLEMRFGDYAGGRGGRPIPSKTTWQPTDDDRFQSKGMLWFLKSVLHVREPEDGICSVSRILLPDFRVTNPPRLLQQKWVPLRGSRGPREAACPKCAVPGKASTQRTPWWRWLSTTLPSADPVKGWAFFKFMHILLSSNIKCFFFVIGTGACFDRQQFRSQITKARL